LGNPIKGFPKAAHSAAKKAIFSWAPPKPEVFRALRGATEGFALWTPTAFEKAGETFD